MKKNVFRLGITALLIFAVVFICTACTSKSGDPQSSSDVTESDIAVNDDSRDSSDNKSTETGDVTNVTTQISTEQTTEAPINDPPTQKYSYDELMAMDNTCNGFGPGVSAGDDNRPYGAINAQNTYGQYGALFIGESDDDIFLTFDEGYENGYTGQILDTLKSKNVKAVFFVTMHYCKHNPELIRRMIDEGHILGNHSVSHKSMPSLSVQDMESEIMNLDSYIFDTYGYKMYLFRPPMGEYSVRSLCVAQNCGYTTMLWSFAYLDYDTANQPDQSYAVDRITGAAHHGAIFLLHAVSQTNTAILGTVIDNFRSNGFNLSGF